MNEKEQLAEFANNLWEKYIRRRVDELMSDKVGYSRGTVVNNPNTNPPSLDIGRPYNGVSRYRCTEGMSSASEGDEVTILKLGSGNKKNEIVFANGTFTGGFAGSTPIKDIINVVYPIGCLYWSADNTNPEELFEGTQWTQIKDVFILAAGDEHEVDSSGGEETVTLTVEEMPEHGHKSLYYSTSAGSYNWGYNYTNASGKGKFSVSDEEDNSGIGHTGGGQPHNNMPPYLTKYCWQRIA